MLCELHLYLAASHLMVIHLLQSCLRLVLFCVLDERKPLGAFGFEVLRHVYVAYRSKFFEYPPDITLVHIVWDVPHDYADSAGRLTAIPAPASAAASPPSATFSTPAVTPP